MSTKTCRIHGPLSEEQCYRRARGDVECRLCARDRERERFSSPAGKLAKRRKNRASYVNSREKRLASARDYQLRTKLEVLSRYSGGKPRCASCGEEDVRFLGLDHLDGGGKAHKREIGGAGGFVYLWARKNGYPPMFQVLCHNCNVRKSSRFVSGNNTRIKRDALSKYSPGEVLACAVCREEDLRVLTIDHLNGDGAEDRRRIGVRSSTEFYRYLLRSPVRKDLQVLCQNHNLGKRCLG